MKLVVKYMTLGVLLVWTTSSCTQKNEPVKNGTPSAHSANDPAGTAVILTDNRCVTCKVDKVRAKIAADFPTFSVSVVDYTSPEGKELYASEAIGKLPAVLFSDAVTGAAKYGSIQKYVKRKNKYYQLNIRAEWDPTAEICDNRVDDDADGKVDCAQDSCKQNQMCMEKRDKPTVDLFVMSHCPYGTQIEKGMIPVLKLLKGKVDFNLRFVHYAMHGKKEVDEQAKQYCIQKQSKEKFMDYLECFLDVGDGDTCVKKSKIDKTKLAACVKQSDTEFKLTANLDDKTTWLGKFPSFKINEDLAKKYGVRGSPTLVINDVRVSSGRSPDALLKAICQGFKKEPKECALKVSTATPSAGFGWKDSTGGAFQASCDQ